MSSVLQIPKKAQTTILQDLTFSEKEYFQNSSAMLAVCCLCGKGLGDGHTITAFRISYKTNLFCQKHYPHKIN